MGADRFKHGDNVELASVAGDAAGENRSAIDKHGWPVHPRHGDQRARHVLVATADGHITVHARAAHHGFDRIGDHFARDQRIFHALAAHGNAVGNRDGIEDDGLAAGLVGAFFGFQRQFVNVHVARRDVAPGRGDADEGL